MRIRGGACGCQRRGGCANKAVYVDESVHAVDAVGVGAERRMWRWKCILTRPMVQTMWTMWWSVPTQGVHMVNAMNADSVAVHLEKGGDTS